MSVCQVHYKQHCIRQMEILKQKLIKLLDQHQEAGQRIRNRISHSIGYILLHWVTDALYSQDTPHQPRLLLKCSLKAADHYSSCFFTPSSWSVLTSEVLLRHQSESQLTTIWKAIRNTFQHMSMNQNQNVNPTPVLQRDRNAQLLLNLISKRHQKLDLHDHHKHILKSSLAIGQVLGGQGPLCIKCIGQHTAFCHFWELD